MEDKIHEELKLVNEKLDLIIELLRNNQKGSDKMVEHIDFVESVYTVVRNPLNSMVKYVQGSADNKALPEPKIEND
jgi:hypothetical protein